MEKDKELPIFTIDFEAWNNALHVENRGHSSVYDAIYLVQLLNRHKIKAIFYVLHDFALECGELVDAIRKRHVVKSHGHHHYYDEKADRSPYWNSTPMPFPPSGGFFFRLLPLWYIKWAVKKSGIFWIHPHDVDEGHPGVKNPLLNWKRHVGLKNARKKLERLVNDIEWGDPSTR